MKVRKRDLRQKSSEYKNRIKTVGRRRGNVDFSKVKVNKLSTNEKTGSSSRRYYKCRGLKLRLNRNLKMTLMKKISNVT